MSILVIKDDKTYAISDSNLIKDWQELKYIPDTDKLLDWRMVLMRVEPEHESEEESLIKEILGTDYLLDLNSKI